MLVQLIKRNIKKVTTFAYISERALETALRGHSADLIIFHGGDRLFKDIGDPLYYTLQACVASATNGKIIDLGF